MESKLIGASLKSRNSFELIDKYLSPASYSREYQLVLGKIKEYYTRDREVDNVDRGIFIELVNQSITNAKHQVKFQDIIDEAYAVESSVNNLEEMIISAKRGEVADKLSVALANRSPKTDELLEEYQALANVSSLEDLTIKHIEVLGFNDMARVIEAITTGEGTLKLYPLALDRKVESGVRGGHHITIFAPPEMGKTGLSLTLASGFARQGAGGLYLGNEDPMKSIYFRAISCMTGMTKHSIQLEPRKAMALAEQRGFKNTDFVSLEPGTLREIEALVDKRQPRWIVVDQLMNLDVKGDGKSQQLGAAVRGLRTIGKKYDCVVVSVTQAGDSATGRAVLDMGDVYMSNTEVPAQADLMIGIGADAQAMQSGYRTLSLPKNKISGRHEQCVVRFNPLISRYQSIGDSD